VTNRRQVWQLYLTATKTATRPSELAGLKNDPWLMLQFDNAVIFTGSVIESAAQEMEKVGTEEKPEWRPKYTMQQLLDPEFRLPSGKGDNEESGFDDFMAFIDDGRVRGLKFDEVG